MLELFIETISNLELLVILAFLLLCWKFSKETIMIFVVIILLHMIKLDRSKWISKLIKQSNNEITKQMDRRILQNKRFHMLNENQNTKEQEKYLNEINISKTRSL